MSKTPTLIGCEIVPYDNFTKYKLLFFFFPQCVSIKGCRCEDRRFLLYPKLRHNSTISTQTSFPELKPGLFLECELEKAIKWLSPMSKSNSKSIQPRSKFDNFKPPALKAASSNASPVWTIRPFFYFAVVIGVFWNQEWRAMERCCWSLLTRQFSSVFTLVAYGSIWKFHQIYLNYWCLGESIWQRHIYFHAFISTQEWTVQLKTLRRYCRWLTLYTWTVIFMSIVQGYITHLCAFFFFFHFHDSSRRPTGARARRARRSARRAMRSFGGCAASLTVWRPRRRPENGSTGAAWTPCRRPLTPSPGTWRGASSCCHARCTASPTTVVEVSLLFLLIIYFFFLIGSVGWQS